MLAPWKESYDQPIQRIKKKRYHLDNEVLYSQSCGFPSSHVWMGELDHKEGSLCGSLDWRGVWERMDKSICMAESFRCSPETIKTLLICCTPI